MAGECASFLSNMPLLPLKNNSRDTQFVQSENDRRKVCVNAILLDFEKSQVLDGGTELENCLE